MTDQTHNSLLRRYGAHRPAGQLLTERLTDPAFPLWMRGTDSVAGTQDDILIDEALVVSWPPQAPLAPPQSGTTFGGWSASQRGHFFAWLKAGGAPQPAAFLRFYLAHLEAGLLESGEPGLRCREELDRLAATLGRPMPDELQRAWLLSLWIRQEPRDLIQATVQGLVNPAYLGTVLGWQALMGQDLTDAQWVALVRRRRGEAETPGEEGLVLLLDSVRREVGGSLLTYALAQVDPARREPVAWRCNHRDLRLALPQPNLVSSLEFLMDQALSVGGPAPDPPPPDSPSPEAGTPSASPSDWQVMVEFGQSRSNLFAFALALAQKESSFRQLLDENRRFVYRVTYPRRGLRRFWRLWDYVGTWSATRVYLHGEELEKWKIYPYSPYMN